MLLLAALILLLAGPKIIEPNQAPTEKGTQTVVFLDNSASMTGWGAPAQIKETLGRILMDNPGPIGVVTLTEKYPVSQANRTFLEEYDPAKSPLSRGDPQNTITTAISLFSPDALQRKLLILSDFQSSQWQLATAQLGNYGVHTTLYPVAPERDGNLSIQNVRTSPAADDQIRIWAQISNHSSKKLQIPVSLHTGEESTQQDLTLDADQSGQVQFLLPRDEYLRGKITISEDSYQADNIWHFWLMAPPPSKIEFMLTPDKEPIGKEESFFLRTAVLSSTKNEWQSYNITHNTLKPGDEPNPELQAVFIPGLDSHISPELLEVARKHATNGGKLVITPGSSTAEMISRLREQDLLNADYRGTQESYASGLDPFRIKRVVPGSPLADVFNSQAAKDLYLAQVHKYIAIRPRDQETKTLLEMEDGSPLLIHSPLGTGNLFLFTTRFHSSWSDLPLRNSFLPIIREILSGYGEQITRQWPNIAIGQQLSSDKPDSEPFLGDEAGLYQWEDQLISVNTAREESAPEVLAMDTVRQNLGASNSIQKKAQSVNLTSQDDTEEDNSLLRWIALFAIALLLIECLWIRPKSTTETV